VAWAAIDRSETLDLVIHGWRGGLAKRAPPRGRLFYEASERPKRTPLDLPAREPSRFSQ
jgi:hypothetical protein